MTSDSEGLVPGATHPFTLDPETGTVSWTVDGFDALSEQGLLPGRHELLEGRIHAVVRDARHDRFALGIERSLVVRFGRDRVRSAVPVLVSTCNLPEADLVVLGPADDRMPDAPWVRACDVGLVVAVADATVPRDRTVKAGVYAAAGIPEYWLVDVVRATVTLHRVPRDGRYHRVGTVSSRESFAPSEALDDPISLSAMLAALDQG